MPMRNSLVYLTPASNDMEEIVKYHILHLGGTIWQGHLQPYENQNCAA